MARGIVDVSISESITDARIVLVTECYNGYAEELQSIRDGISVSFKKGDVEQQVTVYREKGDECAFHYLEISPQMAKEMDLRDGARYLLEHDELKSTLTLTRVLVSKAQVPLIIDRSASGRNRISIGYSLLSQLGMTSSPSKTFVVKDGSDKFKVGFHVPNNELDDSFRLPASFAARYGIQEGSLYTLEYNQSTKTLQCVENGLTLSYFVSKPRQSKTRTKNKTAPIFTESVKTMHRPAAPSMPNPNTVWSPYRPSAGRSSQRKPKSRYNTRRLADWLDHIVTPGR